MHRLYPLAVAGATLTVLACGGSPQGQLRYGVTFDGDPGLAAQRVEARLAAVDQRDDVDLGEVTVTPASGKLTVTIGVRAGDDCGGFALAKDAVRRALEVPGRLALREVVELDDALVEAARAALGDGFEVERRGYRPALAVKTKDGAEIDVAARVRGHGTAAADLYAEKVVERDAHGARTGSSYDVWALSKDSALKDGDIAKARAAYDERQEPVVMVEMTAAGGRRFYDLTARLVEWFVAIVVDDEVIGVPRVEEPISGGAVRISLGRGGSARETLDEARQLAGALAGGPIARDVRVVEEAASCTPR